jgi:hypothetical protein
VVPPAPFALLVADAVGDCMTAVERVGLTGPNADPRVHDALVHLYLESVWPKFIKRRRARSRALSAPGPCSKNASTRQPTSPGVRAGGHVPDPRC